MNRSRILVIAGPTAVGKTRFAIEAVKALDGEIVSCDSMQLYKYMDIGSAKPTALERQQAVHHLVDFLDPRDDFSVARYQQLAKEAIADILARGKLPIIAGGTGLYLNSILYDMDFAESAGDQEYRRQLEQLAASRGNQFLHDRLAELDPKAAETIHVNNLKKIIRALERLKEGEGSVRPFSQVRESAEYDPLLLGLTRERAELYERIDQRVDLLMAAGLLQEVRSLMDMGLSIDNVSMKGIGYKELIEHLQGECTLEEAVEKIKKNTRHYAKRQLTWFRRYDKINWLDISTFGSDEEAVRGMIKWLKESL